MTTDYLVKGLIIGFSVAAPVGPIGVLTIKQTLTEGRTSGFFTGMGAALADLETIPRVTNLFSLAQATKFSSPIKSLISKETGYYSLLITEIQNRLLFRLGT
jgi:threonine/homoserine/homoserine lactone efflux protein